MEITKNPQVCGTVTIGERGQIVIPCSLRDKMKLKKGDKLVVFCHQERIIGLIRFDQLDEIIDKITNRMRRQAEKIKKELK